MNKAQGDRNNAGPRDNRVEALSNLTNLGTKGDAKLQKTILKYAAKYHALNFAITFRGSQWLLP